MSTESRESRLRRGILTSLFSRGLAAVAPILIIPVVLPYLGPTMFGVWATALAVSYAMAWADLGLGGSLVTQLTTAVDRADLALARRLIASCYSVVGSITCTLLIVLWGSSWLVPWETVIGVADPSLSRDARLAVLLLLSCFVLNVLASLIHRILYAHQRISLSNNLQGIGSVASLLLTVGAVALKADPLLVIVASVAGAIIVNTGTTMWILAHLDPDGRPGVADIDSQTAAKLLSLGWRFLVISILTTFALSLDPILISHVLGPEKAGEYAVYARVLGALGLMITLVNSPLWPLQGEAISRNEAAWVSRITLKMIALSSLGVLLGAVLIFLLRAPIFSLLARSHFDVSAALIAALGLWWACVAALSPLFMVQNAAGVVGPQIVGWALFATVGIAAKLLVLSMTEMLWTFVVSGAVCYGLFLLPSAVVGYRKSLNAINDSSRQAADSRDLE